MLSRCNVYTFCNAWLVNDNYEPIKRIHEEYQILVVVLSLCCSDRTCDVVSS